MAGSLRNLSDEALLQQAQLLKLETTNKGDLQYLRGWLDHPDGGDFFLEGDEADTWDDENPEEYVTLYSEIEEKDSFTLWARNTFVRRWHNRIFYRFKVLFLASCHRPPCSTSVEANR
jgi:hypothetical protein